MFRFARRLRVAGAAVSAAALTLSGCSLSGAAAEAKAPSTVPSVE